MSASSQNVERIRYKVGIDVGLRSIGFCAVQVDADDRPVKLLNTVVHVHDAGTPSPGESDSLRKLSGLAARSRRRLRAKKARLKRVDALLTEIGWPIVPSEDLSDPRDPWRIRRRLVNGYIVDDETRAKCLSIAVRHIARHRGWRNPYTAVDTLFRRKSPSAYIAGLKERVDSLTGGVSSDNATQGELIAKLIECDPTAKVRGFVHRKGKATKELGVLEGKYYQSDLVNELRRICECQRVCDSIYRRLVREVFASKKINAKDSKGKRRVGLDELQLKLHPDRRLIRAERAHPAFQKFRIVATLANIRVKEDGGRERRLSADEICRLTDYLMENSRDGSQTWEDVAKQIGITRDRLLGSSRVSVENGGALRYPPADETTARVMNSGVEWLIDWWRKADEVSRGHMIDELSNGAGSETADVVDDEVVDLIMNASEDDISQLEVMVKKLPGGRAAYSLETLRSVTRDMLSTGRDLSESIKSVFLVEDGWQPTPSAIEEPVGNPSVDRVLKQVSRWLKFAVKRWGRPAVVNIEHTREGLKSSSLLAEEAEERKKWESRRRKTLAAMYGRLGVSGPFRRSDQIRYELLDLQDCICLYCGSPIMFDTFELDHIIPRVDVSSNSRKVNMAAVCQRCNKAKGGLPFGKWVKSDDCPGGVSLDGAISRVKRWSKDRVGMSTKAMNKWKQATISRLNAEQPFEEFDGRSLESVAWMAVELRKRVVGYLNASQSVDSLKTTVNVYSGSITSCARKAAHIDKKVQLLRLAGRDPRHKNRFDRRHHVMDALVISLMNPSVARTIALREDFRISQQVTQAAETWKTYSGDSEVASRKWKRWIEDMAVACCLLNDAIASNAIPVTENLRLRNSGRLHAEMPDSLKKARKGSKRTKPEQYTLADQLPSCIINRVTDPALWTALVRAPGYDPERGLPADSDRRVRVRGMELTGHSLISYFPTDSPAIAVQGGYVGLEFHHVRLYRIDGVKPTYALLRVCAIDLVGMRSDLFSADLKPSSMSMRTASPKLKAALEEGVATPIGWLVQGDELAICPSKFNRNAIGEFLDRYPSIKSWRVSAFNTPSKIGLKPRLLANEALPKGKKPTDEDYFEVDQCIMKIMKTTGWVVEINALLGSGGVRVIRRNVLGEVRYSSDSGLPVTLCLE